MIISRLQTLLSTATCATSAGFALYTESDFTFPKLGGFPTQVGWCTGLNPRLDPGLTALGFSD